MKIPVTCSHCNITFLKDSSRVLYSKDHYCSKQCFRQSKTRHRRKKHELNIITCQYCNTVLNSRNITKCCLLCYSKHKKRHTEQTKQTISEKRKAFLQKNPDLHPWKSKKKFISEPCEHFKRILRENHYQFLEEFSPSSLFNYSIDIVFPEKMIGIEINGNQHYEKDGNLKKYYQDRHDHIESLGWKLYEIHYSFCFNSENILNLLEKIKLQENVKGFDYQSYLSTKKQKKTNFCICGQTINLRAKRCLPCQQNKRRKIQRPSKSELHNLVWTVPVFQLSKIFGVSDTAIANWCKNYTLQKPDRGFWTKFQAKQIIDYQI